MSLFCRNREADRICYTNALILLFFRTLVSSLTVDRLVLEDERKSNNVPGFFFCFSLRIAVIRFYKASREYIIYKAYNIHAIYICTCGFVFLCVVNIYGRKTKRSFNFFLRSLRYYIELSVY